MLNILFIGNKQNDFDAINMYLNEQLGQVEISISFDKKEVFDSVSKKRPDIILLEYTFDSNKGVDFCYALKNKYTTNPYSKFCFRSIVRIWITIKRKLPARSWIYFCMGWIWFRWGQVFILSSRLWRSENKKDDHHRGYDKKIMCWDNDRFQNSS